MLVTWAALGNRKRVAVLIETVGLTKRYGEFTALDDCTLAVSAGEIFGLLGPNGAGKTTLIRTLLGFLRPSAGSARVAGWDCFTQSVQVRENLSYLPAEAKLFRRMRGSEVLQFFAAVRGPSGDVMRSLRMAGRLDLDLTRRVAMMSTGMRQKLALAATLAQETPLLILDEPTANLDPNVRSEVLQILLELRDEGRTVLLSSHVLSEIEEACNRVVILRQGQVVHTQWIEELRRRHRITGTSSRQTIEVPDALQTRVRLLQTGPQVTMETAGELADLLPWLATLGLSQLTVEPYGLRSVYNQYHRVEAF